MLEAAEQKGMEKGMEKGVKKGIKLNISIARLLQEGKNPEEIAELLAVPDTLVHEVIKEMNDIDQI